MHELSKMKRSIVNIFLFISKWTQVQRPDEIEKFLAQ